ncbi:MAG: ATP-binding cassette domain-containing protein [Desulfurococcales archaeon]|nr:ATP-binding cassette domain-containing protein [Desulfurococcales archaeon]
MKPVRAEGLTKVYGEFTAVDGVSLEIGRGEVYSLLGPNGAGKTTTIKMLSTLAKPTRGDAFIEGYSVVRESREVRRVIGLAPQDLTADDEMTGWDNVYLQARLYGLSPWDARRRAREVLEMMDLYQVAHRKVATYSGGMRKRLEIAMSLVHEPTVLFLDEPTLGLDVQSRRKLWGYIQGFKRSGMTILLTTHYMEEADFLSDRVGIMHKGRIVAEGTPEELKSMVKGETAYIEPLDPLNLEEVKKALEARGFKVWLVGPRVAVEMDSSGEDLPEVMKAIEPFKLKSVTVSKPTLEEVFVRLTGQKLDESEEEPLDSFAFRRIVRGVRR